MDPQEILALMRQARLERREDLQSMMDSHIGTTATTILLQSQARRSARLIAADPNTPVDVPVDVPVGSGNSGEAVDDSVGEST